jgi:hypothetical protein
MLIGIRLVGAGVALVEDIGRVVIGY